MENITIPSHIYVGFRSQHDSSILGFATHFHEKKETASFLNRKETVDNWHGRRYYSDKNRKIFPQDVIENNPKVGFKFFHDVQGRYSTGAKYARFLHPEGFELELGMDQLSALLQYAVIDHGEIKSKCVLGWLKGRIVVIPEDDKIYKESLEYTKVKEKSVSFKKIYPGDLVFLRKFHASLEAVYLGNFTIQVSLRDDKTDEPTFKKVKLFLYEEKYIYAQASPKVLKVIKHQVYPFATYIKDDIIDYLDNSLRKEYHEIWGYRKNENYSPHKFMNNEFIYKVLGKFPCYPTSGVNNFLDWDCRNILKISK